MALYLGKKKITPIKVVDLPDDLDKELTDQETLLNKLEEDVNSLSDKDDTLFKILEGTAEEFDNTKIGLTQLAPRLLNYMLNIKKANFEGILEIPNYTCQGCANLKEIILDPHVAKIGEYAFYECKFDELVLRSDAFCSIGANCFNYSRGIVGLIGKFGEIGTYAFSNGASTDLHTIDITMKGSFNSYNFQNSYKVDTFKISDDSVVTAIGSYAFSAVGSSRENPENNIFSIDFTNSNFTTLSSYSFGSSNSTNINRYYNLVFPQTVTSVSSNAFVNSDNMTLYFKSKLVPNAHATSFSNATNLKIFVDFNMLDAYKNATNWSLVSDNIYGFADANVFEKDQILPEYSLEGFKLTWYGDSALTNQVFTVDDPNKIYYCTKSSEQYDVVGFVLTYEEDSKVVVTNKETGYVYSAKEGIPVGTTVIISATATKTGYIPYILTLNDTNISTSYEYVTTLNTNLTITSIFYNGVDAPIDPIFERNSWAVIKQAVQQGVASQYWAVGDTKQLIVDGYTYNIRISDMTQGQYVYADGVTPTNMVFESVELLPDIVAMNSTATTVGGWSDSQLRTNLNTNIIKRLPTSLSALLEDIVIYSEEGNDSKQLVPSLDKLFIPSKEEVEDRHTAVKNYAYWEYYRDKEYTSRKKCMVGQVAGNSWWTRTPLGTNRFYAYTEYGTSSSNIGANNSRRTCICWAW